MTKKRTKVLRKKGSAKAQTIVQEASSVNPEIHLPTTIIRGEISLLQRLLRVHETGDRDPVKVSEILRELAISYGNLGDDAKKRALLERALRIQEEHYGLAHRAIAITLTRLGDAYRCLGDLEKAQAVLERAVRIQETIASDDVAEAIQQALSLTRLSVIHQMTHNINQAHLLLERALGIYELHHLTDLIEAAETLGYLGSVHRSMGNPSNAKDFLERALAIEEKHYGKNHVGITATLTNLGVVYRMLEDLEKSKTLLERALVIKEAHYGPEHVALVATLTNLGSVYQALEDFPQAKRLLQRGLRLKEHHYGASHLEVGQVLIALGFVYYATGEMEEGVHCFERAERIAPDMAALSQCLWPTAEHIRTTPTELVFDLHGYSVKDAKTYVLRGLAHAYNVKKIRIITGRGNHVNASGSRGVLYQKLPSWLAESAYHDRIEQMYTYDGYYELHLYTHENQRQTPQNLKVLSEALSSNIGLIQEKADEGDPIGQFIFGTHLMEKAKTDADFKRAFGYCLKSAKSGNTDAMMMVANHYMVGRGCRQNDPEALRWLEKALALGNTDAALSLGELYWGGYGVKVDPVRAVFYYEISAANHHLVGIRKLANAYSNGIGVSQDKKKGFELYKKAADLGEVTSQYNVGCMYAQGAGVAPDPQLAHQYFLLAAQSGDPDAQFYVGDTFLSGELGVVDVEKGDYWIRLAAENGSTQALERLRKKDRDNASLLVKSAEAGNIFDKVRLKLQQRGLSEGTEEVLAQVFDESYRETRDLSETEIMHLAFQARFYLVDELLNDKKIGYRKKAVRILQSMAEHGCIFSMRRLFYVYHKGIGVTVDEQQALAYLRQGHERQDAKCTMYLGSLYEKRAEKDDTLLEQAWHSYREAATLGYPPANYRMGLYSLHHKKVQDGISYFERAIELEKDKSHIALFDSGAYDAYSQTITADAASRLAALYFMKHSAQDLSKGFEYVRLAAQSGSEYAIQFLEKIKQEGVMGCELDSWLKSMHEESLRSVADDGLSAVEVDRVPSCELLAIDRILKQYKATDLGQAFRRAAGFGSVQDLSLILALAPDVLNQFGADTQKTALHVAAQQQKLDHVQFLLEMGADQTLRDNQNKTALEYCPSLLVEEPSIQSGTDISGSEVAPLLMQFGRHEPTETVEDNHSVFNTVDEQRPMKLCPVL